jgi:hypothetical protein
MAITLNELNEGRVLEVHLSGKLAKEDYEAFEPTVERLIRQHGKIRMQVELHDFHGWTPGAIWEDTKFAAQHFGDIERLAVIGETKWQQGMALFCRPFTKAKVRYFDQTEIDAAEEWVQAA